MENTSVKTTFWKFIEDYQIEIPIIQRDYAQGRLGKENLRKGFLSDLKHAIDCPTNEMKLDFVYGSTSEGKLYPLDGQQRLTTLWLLHWYVALRAGVLEDAANRLKNFSYETRISSREFCQNLCKSNHFLKYDREIDGDIVGYIQHQTWFYSAWKQDPTIQSMLRMLGGTVVLNKKGEPIKMEDGLEDIFPPKFSKDNMEDYWKNLISDNCPIVFYYLQLDNFGLSDDLYIKMNARGKQLTSFENFKADLIGYIQRQANNDNLSKEEHREWVNLLNPKEGIPIKIDTTWTDIFWDKRSVGIKQPDGNFVLTNQIDEIYFAFINRFFWNELFIATDKNGKHILDLNGNEKLNRSYQYLNDEKENKSDYDEKIAYQGLDTYRYLTGEIPLECFQKLATILDHLHQYKKELPLCPWNSSFRYIPEYEIKEASNDEKQNIKVINNSSETILKVTTLTQVQRIAFFALCKYFNDAEADEQSLKRWMRVVWNLISGEGTDGHPQIRSTDAMRSAIEIINKLDSHHVYESLRDDKACILSKSKNNRFSDFEQRYKEEVAKAIQILDVEDDSQWVTNINTAEQYMFFKGSIRFLFTHEDGTYKWNDFDTKFKNVKDYFDKDGVKKEYSPTLLRKLVSLFDTWDMFMHITYDSTKGTWLKLLLEEKWRKPIHKLLIDNSQPDFANFQSSLNNRIQKQIHEELVQSNLLQFIVKGCFLNVRGDYHIMYPYNAHAEWKKYIIGSNRNSILASLHKSKRISTNQRLDKCDYFWGWDIIFEYKKKEFRWTWNSKLILNSTAYEKKLKPLYTEKDILYKLDEMIAQTESNN